MSNGQGSSRDELVAELRKEIDDLKNQLEQHEMRATLHNDAVADVSRAIYQLDSFEKTAALVFQACKRATGARSGYVAMLDQNGAENTVVYLDAGGMPCTVDPELPMPIRGLRGEAYKSKKPAYDNQFSESRWMKYMPPGHVTLKNVLFAPMIIGTEAKGLIGLGNKPGGFTEADAEIAMSYAGIAAIALQSSEMIEGINKARSNLQDAYQDSSFLKDLLVHDINNVFQSISSTVELWKLKIAKGLPATGMVDSLTQVSDNVFRGAHLISSIQKLERLSDPKLACELLDVMQPLKETIELVKKRFPSRQIGMTINVDNEPALASVMDLIRDAFENILINAVKHNTNANVTIEISVTHAIDAGAPAIRIEFADNGPGIEDERKPVIFDRVMHKKRSKEGMGIGLSVVKRILTRCGGKIWVEDAVQGDSSRGSKFIVILPAAPVGAHDHGQVA